GTGVRSDYLYQPETIPMYYEAGTQNIPGIFSLYQGVKYIMETGIDHIRESKEEIVQQIRYHLSRNDRVNLFPSITCKFKPTLFCFTIQDMESEDIGYILENNFDIIVRSGLHCAPLIHQNIGTFPFGSVRVSPSHFTTKNEINIFTDAINQTLQMVEK
ncbi:MAG: aminotransferase class V-fold PLP-dependent enzyme, partial [Melioribacteraceae bacterium]|nr:aminotransferase class V-fold PLP-dependent enzyme [Melioribacteraceae bacterium]